MNDTVRTKVTMQNPFEVVTDTSSISAQQPDNPEGTLKAKAQIDDPPSREDASRFLGQAGFGGTDGEIDEVARIGYRKWIDNQLNQPLPRQSRYEWLEAQNLMRDSLRFKANTDFDHVNWRRLISDKDVLRLRMSLALSELFVVNPKQIPKTGGFKAFGAAAYMDMLDERAFGSYRELLGAVTTSLQMGAYLSMRGSRKADNKGRAPDENYAREILQLFSIGLVELEQNGIPTRDADGNTIDTYSQEDVVGLSAIFTGWDDSDIGGQNSNRRGARNWKRPMRFISNRHQDGLHTFLGVTINSDNDGEQALNDALDHIAAHQNVAPFISRQLIQRFVTSNPTPDYVERVAAVFSRNEGLDLQLGEVLKTILLDTEARKRPGKDDKDTYGKVREPIIRFVQWARTFKPGNLKQKEREADSNIWTIRNLSSSATELGQSPLRASSVFNFFRPAYTPPGEYFSERVLPTDPDRKLVAPELQIVNESSVIGYANFMHRVVARGKGPIVPEYLREESLSKKGGKDPGALINHLDVMLTGGSLSDETRELIINTIKTMKSRTDDHHKKRVHASILLIMVSTDYLVQR